jgi:cysteinyl-tRNA synthetase
LRFVHPEAVFSRQSIHIKSGLNLNVVVSIEFVDNPFNKDGEIIMYKRLMIQNNPGFIYALIIVFLLIFSGLTFPVVSASGTITVTAPIANENWQRGRTKTITWNSTGSVGSTVDIDLYKNDIYNREIANATSNDGSYSWSIPTDLDAELNYTIKITSCTDSMIFDFSGAYFSIGLDKLEFSGYTWVVRDTQGVTQGPGPNYFSSSPENVWLDSEGKLHLKITNRNGVWFCAEIYSEDSFGYGTYTFFTDSRVDIIDINSVLGLFTYLDDTNETDIEFSRWGWVDGKNAGYTCQPWQTQGNSHNYDLILPTDYSTHSFNWQSDYIQFRSLYGHFYVPPTQDYVIQKWNYTGPDIAAESTERAHMNLWLMGGLDPSDGQEVEAVISKFNFTESFTVLDPQDTPAPPLNLNSELYPSAIQSDVRLVWDASSDDGAGDMDVSEYVIYRSKDIMGPYSNIATLPATASPSYTYIDSGAGDGDLNNYFYKVHAIDYLGAEELNVNRVAKWTTQLDVGWNIFSIPVLQNNSARTEVLTTIEGNYTSIQSYDPGKSNPWQHWHMGKPDPLNTLTDIEYGKGYYIEMKVQDHLVTVGEVPGEHDIELAYGWNLIGNPFITSLSVQDADLPSEIDLVGYYEKSTLNNEFKRYDPIGKSGDTIELKPGKGYWAHSKTDLIWTVPFESIREPIPLSQVQYWAYQIQKINEPGVENALAGSNYDMLVLEPTRTDWSSSDRDFDTKAMVERLKATNASDGVHGKLILAYIDIGEAENWRWYWNWSKDWPQGEPKPADWPDFIVYHDPDGWEDCYPVAYWDPEWKDIIIYGNNHSSAPFGNYNSAIDEAIKDGFDGIYLDWVEAFEDTYVKEAAVAAGVDPQMEMINFISEMRDYAENRNPNFLIIQQNAASLCDGHSELFTKIDAFAQEAIWYDGDATDDWNDTFGYDIINDPSLTDYYLDYLVQYKAAGTPVFNCEYALSYSADAYTNSYDNGFIPYCSRRSLSKLTTTPPPGY